MKTPTLKPKNRSSARRRSKIDRQASKRYLVMIRKTATGYSADVPDLPGCIAAAASIDKVRKLMAEALGYHLDLMEESSETIPRPTSQTDFSAEDAGGEEFCSWVTVKWPSTERAPKRRLDRKRTIT
jgi:predicted RNase H-like HicB family nuclease